MSSGRIDSARTNAGFSLIEVLVVLAIISIAMITILPNYRNPTKRVELHATALNVVGALRAARIAAISRSRPIGVDFDITARRYFAEAAGSLFQLPADCQIVVTTAREFTRGAGAARIVFFPDGSSTGGRITLRRDQVQFNIGVDWLTGQARLEAGS